MKKPFAILLTIAASLQLGGGAIAGGIDYASGTPWPDADLEGVAEKVRKPPLKDNFALAVNREKLLALEIPQGYSSGGTITDLKLKQKADLKAMFLGKEPEGHDAKLAHSLFRLMMDWKSRNAQGAAPLKKAAEAVEKIDSIEALDAYFLKTPVEDQLAGLWSAASGPGYDDASRNVLMVGPCSLLLDDSAEYKKTTAYGAVRKKAYSELARKMLARLGYAEKDAVRKIDGCFAFETMLASAVMPDSQKKGPDRARLVNNHFTHEELAKAQGAVPVLSWLAHAGYPEEKDYVVLEPRFLERLGELYAEKNLAMIKDFLIVRGALDAAELLDRECYEWSWECRNAISGAEGMLPDEEAFASSAADMLKWPAARLYAETHLKQEDKDRISGLIDRLLAAWRGIIAEADFLAEATKKNALRKLDAVGKRVLFPDSWEKYECRELNFASPEEGGTLWQAVRRINAWDIAKNAREHPLPVDKEKWDMPPFAVNCFYDPQVNAVYVMGAFAQGEIYHAGMREEELLARLGWVVGHEISHAFDSSGAQFDEKGDLKNWWTPEDYAAFRARNEKMIAYYAAMHPWAGQDFRAGIMTGEAGADMAGMKAALRIAAEQKSFDYDRLFRSFAGVWLVKQTLEASYAQINDVHPMGYLRINCTLQQFDEFLAFYGIKEGDGMYLAPKDRVVVW